MKSVEKLSLLFAASEAAPFAKEGGLGDVVGALPKYLARLGHDVRVVIPRYYSVNREKYGLRLLPGTLTVPMGIIGHMYCGVYEGRLPGSDVPIYFLEHEQFYGRAGLYQQDGKGYLDNDNRFVFLSKAALELCKMLDFHPDVIHAHDWHTGVIPALLNTSYLHDRYVGDAASLLTLHNMQHQGNFYPGLMEVLGIGWKHFNYLDLEKDDQVNLLKGGIYHATLLNTVSEGYAAEIQTAEYGWGLEDVVRERAADLYGILNGVDYDEWNPASDPLHRQEIYPPYGHIGQGRLQKGSSAADGTAGPRRCATLRRRLPHGQTEGHRHHRRGDPPHPGDGCAVRHGRQR